MCYRLPPCQLVPNHRCRFSSCRQPTHPHFLIYCLSPPHLSPQPRIQLRTVPTETRPASFNGLPQLEMQEEITREKKKKKAFFWIIVLYLWVFIMQPSQQVIHRCCHDATLNHDHTHTHTHAGLTEAGVLTNVLLFLVVTSLMVLQKYLLAVSVCS